MAATAKRAAAPDVRRDMEKELAAAEALKFQLSEVYDDGVLDTELLSGMVEGETGLFETIDAMLRQISADDALAAALTAEKKRIDARKARLETRSETMRTMIAMALEILEERRIDRPLGVISLKALAPSLQILDEAAIPSQFFKTPEPSLSRKDLTDALKDRRDTLEQKLAEITAAVEGGAINADQANEHRERIIAAFPEIPGAVLNNGGTTVQIRFS